MNWELQRHDWSSLRANGDASKVPEALIALQNATDEGEALRAYWRIDNVVVVQGALFEAAFPTVTALSIGLSNCTDVARPHILELLVQLVSGEPTLSERISGNEALAEDCRSVLPNALSTLFALLETAHPNEQMHCIDLLGMCAQVAPQAKDQVMWYLTCLIARENGQPSATLELARTWLASLRE